MAPFLDSHTRGWRRYSCCRESTRKEVVDVNNDLYTKIGYFVALCMKYIFIPIGVGVAIRLITRKLLQPQPERQKKKRL